MTCVRREGKQNSSGLFVYFSVIFLDCGKPQKSKQKCRTILMSHVGFRIIFRSWKGLQNNSLLTCVFYIRVYDLMFFDEVAKIEAHESEVLCVEFSPNESGMNVNPRDFILICGWSLCGNWVFTMPFLSLGRTQTTGIRWPRSTHSYLWYREQLCPCSNIGWSLSINHVSQI